jgi:hypothetical protein
LTSQAAAVENRICPRVIESGTRVGAVRPRESLKTANQTGVSGMVSCERRIGLARTRRGGGRWLAAAVAACAVAIGGCGGTGSAKTAATQKRPPDTIAEVSGGYVTRQELEHWLPIEAVLA